MNQAVWSGSVNAEVKGNETGSIFVCRVGRGIYPEMSKGDISDQLRRRTSFAMSAGSTS